MIYTHDCTVIWLFETTNQGMSTGLLGSGYIHMTCWWCFFLQWRRNRGGSPPFWTVDAWLSTMRFDLHCTHKDQLLLKPLSVPSIFQHLSAIFLPSQYCWLIGKRNSRWVDSVYWSWLNRAATAINFWRHSEDVVDSDSAASWSPAQRPALLPWSDFGLRRGFLGDVVAQVSPTNTSACTWKQDMEGVMQEGWGSFSVKRPWFNHSCPEMA